MTQKRLFEFGGYGAALILVAFGLASIVMGITGRNEVRTDIKREYIVGSADMNKQDIRTEAKAAGLPQEILDELPTCNVAGKAINTGARAKCFAAYMRIHTFESTGGKTYSQMGRFLAKDGGDTNDPTKAKLDPKTGKPIENGGRNLWITATALMTALNTSFFAEQVALFSMVIGVALLLVGAGLAILAYMSFRWLPAHEARKAAAPPAVTATPQAT